MKQKAATQTQPCAPILEVHLECATSGRSSYALIVIIMYTSRLIFDSLFESPRKGSLNRFAQNQISNQEQLMNHERIC